MWQYRKESILNKCNINELKSSLTRSAHLFLYKEYKLFLLFKETFVVYCENHSKYINTACR